MPTQPTTVAAAAVVDVVRVFGLVAEDTLVAIVTVISIVAVVVRMV